MSENIFAFCGFRKGKSKGFTLIELLVVIVIIAILAAIALPRYNYAVLNARYTALMPQMRAVADAMKRYRLATGSDARSLDALDITVGSDIGASVSSYNSFNITGAIGDYTGKTSVWLSLRQGHGFKMVCETFAAYAPGVKLCLAHGGVKRTCESSIWMGMGTINCYELPMPGAA